MLLLAFLYAGRIFFTHRHDHPMALITHSITFFLLYLIQAVCLRAGLEASTYLQGDAFKKALDGYWIFFYAFPVLTTCLIFKDVQQAVATGNFGLRKKGCLSAYTDGRKAWRQNQLAFFLQKRGIIYTFIFSTFSFLVINAVLAPALLFSVQNIIIAAVAMLFLDANFFSKYLRRQTLRSLNSNHMLHQLSHHIRDEHSKLLKNLSSSRKASPDDCLRHISDSLELTGNYFKTITQDKSIEVALRLAFPHQEEQDNVVYTTIARTEGLNTQEWMSESIAANEGIPRCLIEDCDSCHVLIYNDLKKAVQEKVFKEMKNGKDFPKGIPRDISKDIGSLMVAPLNAWDGNKKSMIGILYVTAKNKKTFHEEHIDCMRFIADILSDTVSFSIIANHMLIVKGNKNARFRQLLEKY